MSAQQETRRGNKGKKRKEGPAEPAGKDVASKQEYQVARWMRKNIQIKKTKFLSHTVEYFTACKGVDALMDSPWAKPTKPGEEAIFTTRESIVKYLDVMLRHKLFHRARKIVVPESELNKSKKKKDATGDGKDKDEGETESKSKKKKDETKDKEESEAESTKSKKKKEAASDAKEDDEASGDTAAENQPLVESKKDKKKKKKDEAEKKKRKIRLDMHLEQRFVDGLDAYVWIYEPTPFYYYFFGFLVVLAVIAVCLFPLWPSFVRDWVYYLSVAAAGFLVLILALAVIRLIVFSLLWCVTFGNHHLWLLPNLTEDVGFLASFWPLYKYEYKGTVEPEEEEEEEEEDEEEEEVGAGDSKKEKESEIGEDEEKSRIKLEQPTTEGSNSQSETESESSQPSQTGKDFEMVTKEEVEIES